MRLKDDAESPKKRIETTRQRPRQISPMEIVEQDSVACAGQRGAPHIGREGVAKFALDGRGTCELIDLRMLFRLELVFEVDLEITYDLIESCPRLRVTNAVYDDNCHAPLARMAALDRKISHHPPLQPSFVARPTPLSDLHEVGKGLELSRSLFDLLQVRLLLSWVTDMLKTHGNTLDVISGAERTA